MLSIKVESIPTERPLDIHLYLIHPTNVLNIAIHRIRCRSARLNAAKWLV